MENQNTTNLPDTTSDNVTRFITKNGLKSGRSEDRYKPDKQIRFKKSMLQSETCVYRNAYIAVKVTIFCYRSKWWRQKNRPLTI